MSASLRHHMIDLAAEERKAQAELAAQGRASRIERALLVVAGAIAVLALAVVVGGV